MKPNQLTLKYYLHVAAIIFVAEFIIMFLLMLLNVTGSSIYIAFLDASLLALFTTISLPYLTSGTFKSNQSGSFIKLYLLYAIPIIILSISINMYYNNQHKLDQINQHLALVEKNAQSIVIELTLNIHSLLSDVSLLANFIVQQKQKDSGMLVNSKEYQAQVNLLLSTRNNYQQINLIDFDGKNIAQSSYLPTFKSSKPFSIPGHLGYMHRAKRLSKGEALITPLRSIQNDSSDAFLFQPIIRVITPIYYSGKIAFFLSFNYSTLNLQKTMNLRTKQLHGEFVLLNFEELQTEILPSQINHLNIDPSKLLLVLRNEKNGSIAIKSGLINWWGLNLTQQKVNSKKLLQFNNVDYKLIYHMDPGQLKSIVNQSFKSQWFMFFMILTLILLALVVVIKFVTAYSLEKERVKKRKKQEIEEQHELIKHTLVLKKSASIALKESQMKSEFLSNMSHELRTPLNAILGFSQLLAINESLQQEDKESVHEITVAGEHLLRLINEILDLSKIEAGQISLSIENIELISVINECINLIEPLAEQKNIDIKYTMPSELFIQTDRTRLKQVLLNLLSNAIKYNHQDGAVNISVLELKNEENGVTSIAISDTGIGIAADKIKQIFDPFNRLDAENSSTQGTGIGLTITKSIMGVLRGSINVESTKGEGSLFSIQLPLSLKTHKSQRPENFIDETLIKESKMIKNGKKFSILCIEDNPTNLKLISKIISARGDSNLLTSLTPEGGIEIAFKQHPDLILLDINMPGMDGFGVLEIIKKVPDLRQVPVFAITANAMKEDRQRGIEAGFTLYLTKPIDIPLLNQSIDDAILKKFK